MTAFRLPPFKFFLQAALILGSIAAATGCVNSMPTLSIVAPKQGDVPAFLGASGANQFLSWAAGTSPDDAWVVAAADAAPGYVGMLGYNFGASTTPPAGKRAQFALPPLATDQHLNASMPIVANLFIGGQARLLTQSTYVDIQLLLDGVHIAGLQRNELSGSSTTAADSPWFPEKFALVSETAVLPKGGKLVLQITLLGGTQEYKVGLKGTHASNLTFAFVTPVAGEIYLDSYSGGTIPVEQGGARSSSPIQSFPGEPVANAAAASGEGSAVAAKPIPVPQVLALAMASLLGLAFVAGPRRPGRTTAVLLVVIMLAAGLAGCSGKKSADQTDEDAGQASVEEYYEIPAEERQQELEQSGTGDLIGRVFHDIGLPLQGAHVSILHTEFFTQTDDKGRFQFLGLAPDQYDVLVNALGFRSATKEGVEVKLGNVTTLEFILVPAGEAAGGGFTSHKHDIWGTRTSVVLLDGDSEVPQSHYGPTDFGAATGTSVCRAAGTGSSAVVCLVEFFMAPVEASVAPLVPSGTAMLDVTVSWDADANQVPVVGLGYISANLVNPLLMYPKPSGSTWHIPVSHAMADRGHQAFTFWSFYIYIQGTESYAGTEDAPATLTEAFQVKLTARKGIVPFEPVHKDFWNGNTTMTAMSRVEKLFSRPNLDYADLSGIQDLPNPLIAETVFRAVPGEIVPPGTGMLEVRLTWAAGGNTPIGNNYAWGLAMHPANLPLKGFLLKDLLHPAEKDRGAGFVVYEVPLTTAMTDAYYQQKSSWIFFIDDNAEPAAFGITPASTRYQVAFAVSAQAHLDPKYVLVGS